MSHNAHAAVFWKQHLFFSPPLPSHYAVNVYTIQESPCDRIYFHLGWQHKPPFPPAVAHPDVQVVFLYNVTDLNLGNKIVRLGLLGLLDQESISSSRFSIYGPLS